MSLINERIRDCRIKRGLTLLEVAERLGVKEATMQRYESGAIKNIKHETVVALADIFGVSPAYLMGWDENAEESLDQQLSGVDFALYGETKDLTDAQKQDVLDFIRYVKSRGNRE